MDGFSYPSPWITHYEDARLYGQRVAGTLDPERRDYRLADHTSSDRRNTARREGLALRLVVEPNCVAPGCGAAEVGCLTVFGENLLDAHRVQRWRQWRLVLIWF
jgi:hypothetical protein